MNDSLFSGPNLHCHASTCVEKSVYTPAAYNVVFWKILVAGTRTRVLRVRAACSYHLYHDGYAARCVSILAQIFVESIMCFP